MWIMEVSSYPVWAGSENHLLAKVETDEGAYGWGERALDARDRRAALRDRRCGRRWMGDGGR